MEVKYIVRYYHCSGGDTLETLVTTDALQAFITVLITNGYRVTEII